MEVCRFGCWDVCDEGWDLSLHFRGKTSAEYTVHCNVAKQSGGAQ